MKSPILAASLISALAPGLTPLPASADEGHAHGTQTAATAGDHAHKAPHGGLVRTVGSYHYELLVKDDRIQVYLLDGDLKTVAPKGKSGRAILQVPGKGKQTVPLAPVQDHFEGQAALASAKSLVAIVSLNLDGKPQSGRFSWRR